MKVKPRAYRMEIPPARAIDSLPLSCHPAIMIQANRRPNPGNFRCVLLLAVLASGLPLARADWPDFRGPRGDGHVSAPGDTKIVGLPLQWSETSNIKWKTEIPHKGWSTPVIMGGQVWMTTATEAGNDYFAICVDQQSGKILFNE